jgi:hypothetical protein
VTSVRVRSLACAALLAALPGCGDSSPPPGNASVKSCVRKSGARLSLGADVAKSPLVQQGTKVLFIADWPKGSAEVFRASDDDSADAAEGRLKAILRRFSTPDEQVRRQGIFVILLGPERVPPERDRDALAACLH